MVRVEKIQINNARRLGKKVDIDFGEGATIILAPNGTGKTTIFECIELAVTGEIKRIQKSPQAIVRDGCNEMNVELHFTGDQSCKITYNKNGGYKQSGDDLKRILQVDRDVSIPYMFSMTHLFEQHGRNWFVEYDEKKAGEVLGKLPISRDLQTILSKKTALVRSVNAMESRVLEELNVSKKSLEKLEGLINKKEQFSEDVPEYSINDIIIELNLISEAIKSDGYNKEQDAKKVSLYSETLKSELIQLIDKQKAKIEDLIILKERINFFNQNSLEITNKENVVAKLSENENEIKTSEVQAENDINKLNENILNLKMHIARNEDIVSKFNEAEKTRKSLLAKKIKLKEANDGLESKKRLYNEQCEYISNNEKLKDEHKLIDESIKENRGCLSSLNERKTYLKEWGKLLIESQSLYGNLLEYEENKIDIIKIKELNDEKAIKSKENYTERKQNLKNLNSAAEAVQNAVSEIRKHLHNSQTNCPVCQAEYSHEELTARIEKSLKSMNPMIAEAVKEERLAYEEWQNALKEQIDSANKLYNITEKTKIIQNKIDDHKNKITNMRLTYFHGIEELKEAEEHLAKQCENVSMILEELDNRKSLMKKEESIEYVNKINLDKLENERNIKELSAEINNLVNDIALEENEIRNLENDLNGIKINDITEKIAIFKNRTDTEEGKLKETKNYLIQIKEKINQLRSQILTENELISKIKAVQSSIMNLWNNVGIEGEPNLPELEKFYKYLLEENAKNDAFMKKIYNTQESLGKWRVFEEYKYLDNEIKSIIGGYTIEEYLKNLKETEGKCRRTHENLLAKKYAINMFLAQISVESENVRDQINSINGPWREILKRIVVNQKISLAPLLNHSMSRNISKANIQACVNNTNIDMSDYASEGQLADLQLSFMLSMANKYQWTPWKALLLDDPTQHHDLVHASSVFDLLRDYIADLNYQIMFSTHDSVQAKFFQRKLENEGIQSKIYQLVTREDGVIAERIY